MTRPEPKAVDDALYEAAVIVEIVQQLGSRMISGEDVCGTGISWLADQLQGRIEIVRAGFPVPLPDPHRREGV